MGDSYRKSEKLTFKKVFFDRKDNKMKIDNRHILKSINAFALSR